MSEPFDAYFKWLGIPPAEQPPHYYRLLGIQLYESDREVINYASDRQMAHVRNFQLGRYASESQKILNEIAAARVCLLNEQAKVRYDEQLKSRLANEAADSAPPPLPPQQIAAGAPPAADGGSQKSHFLAYLDGALARVAGDIVSQDQEFEITEWGRKKYGLSSEQAYAALRDACSSADKTLASLDRSKKLTPLRSQQPAWSVPAPQATASVAAPTQPAAPMAGAPQIKTSPRRPDAKRGAAAPAADRGVIIAMVIGGVILMGGMVVSVAIVAAVFFLGGKSGQIVARPQPANSSPAAAPRNLAAPGSGDPAAPGSRSRASAGPRMIGAGPSWWDGRTRALSHRAIHMAPESAELVVLAQSDDPQSRAQAYRGLIQLAANSQNAHIVRMVEPVISGGFALDPADSSSAAIRQSLVASIPPASAPSPTTAGECSATFDMLGLLMACVQYNRAPTERVDRMLADAGSRLGTEFTANPARQRHQLDQSIKAALSRRLYQNLAGRIGAGREPLRNAHQAIAQQVERQSGAPLRESLDLQFTLEAIEKHPSQWRNYDFLVQQLCDSGAQETVLKMVASYERADDEGLRRFMSERLLRRANASGASTPAEIAAAVRAHFDGKVPVAAAASPPKTSTVAATSAAPAQAVDPRWDALSRTAGSALADVYADPNDPPKLLQEVVNLAHAATLACAMSQGDEGRAAFDRLRAAGPPVLSAPNAAALAVAPAAPEPRLAPSRAAYENAARCIEVLGNPTTNAKSKVNFLRPLAEMARNGQIPELQGPTAEALAAFLLAPHEPELNAELSKALPEFARLPFVMMALADAMEKTRTDRGQIELLLSAALGQGIQFAAAGDWRDAARNELLSAAAAQLSGEAPRPAAGGDVYGGAIDALGDLYAEQAALLGSPPAAEPSTAMPSAVLRRLIEQMAAELSSADLPPDDQQYIEQVEHRLAAIDFLSDNDLQATIMLQRVWSRLLALYITAQRADAGPRAAALQQQLEASDRNARHILLQLRDGQVKLLEMWLELSRPM